tara:strand:+ start:208 stop:324 length:117 start_codon:yes stop_codon:yes gene_type:complete
MIGWIRACGWLTLFLSENEMLQFSDEKLISLDEKLTVS